MHIIEGLETLKTLPNGVEIDLNGLDEFQKLSERQKILLANYFDTFPQKTVACLRTGVGINSFAEWLGDDNFFSVFHTIKSLHAESLAEVQYKDSYKNPTIRSGTLKALDAEGYERKDRNVNHTHNTLVLQGSLEDMLKKLPNR
jgi:hypothetical protein